MRISCDTGGTFTDLLVTADGIARLFKSPTTPDDPIRGIFDAIDLAAANFGLDRATFLARGTMFVHATTRALNAILTGNVARTAFLTTAGHPDILVIREGGRNHPFDYSAPYPEPYVPRHLTFEIPERVDALGRIIRPLDEAATKEVIGALKRYAIEAVGVSLLWSVANDTHERRVGELLDEQLPGVPFTLSHQLNPTMREYRRSSATCIDASLKPLMHDYMRSLTGRLQAAGFTGQTLMVTSQGGVMDAMAVALAPIHALNSGPAIAPVAGRFYAARDAGSDFAIVADAGGTSYDVGLVRQGRIPWTRETWLGPRFQGHMTGFASVDVKSIGAGGGSIAWIDDGGLLHVGPHSAGASPGPACYAAGGSRPTVTDCALALGYIDPAFFLGGAMPLDVDAASRAILEHVAVPLGCAVEAAAIAVMKLATEMMVGAIEDITVKQGIRASQAVLIGGGGAGGLNAVAVGRRLGCNTVLIPETGAALSAAGALMSELTGEYSRLSFMTSDRFDLPRATAILADLEAECRTFIDDGPGKDTAASTIEFSVEARYPQQVWEIEVSIDPAALRQPAGIDGLVADFHRVHNETFAISDIGSQIEIIAWRARVHCQLRNAEIGTLRTVDGNAFRQHDRRRAYFPVSGWTDIPVMSFENFPAGAVVVGPAIIESPFTTVVLDPGAAARRLASGGLSIRPLDRQEGGAP